MIEQLKRIQEIKEYPIKYVDNIIQIMDPYNLGKKIVMPIWGDEYDALQYNLEIITGDPSTVSIIKYSSNSFSVMRGDYTIHFINRDR